MSERTVTVDRDSVLRLLCDYLEKNGLLVTLTSLEEESQLKAKYSATAALRGEAMEGKWRELEERFMINHEEKGEQHELFKRAHYSLAKQQYLETVARLDAVSSFRETSTQERSEVTSCLQKLKKVAPSQEEYDQLSAISDSSTDFFDNWNIRTARMEVCNHLLAWCREDCEGGKEEEREGGGGGGDGEKVRPVQEDIHQLVVLLVKGKLYEDCEEVFRRRCTGQRGGGGEKNSMIDLRSWLSNQPDSVFQDSPRSTRILAPHIPSESVEKKKGIRPSQISTGSPSLRPASLPQSEPVTAPPQTNPPESRKRILNKRLNAEERSKLVEREEKEGGGGEAKTESTVKVLPHKENEEIITDKLRQTLREEENDANITPSSPPNTQPFTSEEHFCNQLIPPPPPSWALQTTPLHPPLQREDRNSSTPKPSIQRVISSPPASPVPYLPLGDSASSSSKEKQLGRDTTTPQDELYPAVSWPSAKLVGKMTDTQAVRAVAFSESGEMVAVGANSKYLRILSTSSLLDHHESVQEMVILQELPRYHRGSIYTLCWSGDNLLASGSNDKSIKLLVSSSSTTDQREWRQRGKINVHQGTVRELVFLSNTHLLSGGSGNPSLVLSDCQTLKIITTLSGQDKVLSVAPGGQSSTAVSGGEDGTIRMWDWRSGNCIHSLLLSDPVTSLSTSGDSMAVGLGDGSCAVYDMRSWREVTSYQPHSDECRSVCHSPCGNWLLTSSYDGSLCLGEVTERGEWIEIAQHQDKVIQSRWHPSGDIFSSTSSDKTASFWTLHH